MASGNPTDHPPAHALTIGPRAGHVEDIKESAEGPDRVAVPQENAAKSHRFSRQTEQKRGFETVTLSPRRGPPKKEVSSAIAAIGARCLVCTTSQVGPEGFEPPTKGL